jgi:hypothetical protein
MSELLHLADFDELPPSTVDLDAAVRTGRRRERRRRAVTVTAVAALVLVAATGVALAVDRRPAPRPVTPPPTPWTCTVETPKTPMDLVDPSGRIVVTNMRYNNGFPSKGPTVSVDGGPPTYVEMDVVREPDVFATAVNAAGVIVGYSQSNEFGPGVPWVRRDGRTTLLPLPVAGHVGRADTVNARGDILGSSHSPQGMEGETLLWPAARPGTVEVIETGPSGNAVALADDGTVIGTVRDGDGARVVTLWHPDGSTTLLRQIGVVMPVSAVLAGFSAIGVDGVWVFGSRPAGGYRYNMVTGVIEDLGSFMPTAAVADGGLAGRIRPKDIKGFPTPAIWRNGLVTPLPLPSLAEHPVSWDGSQGVDVHRAGGRIILGAAREPVGDGGGLVWRC